MFVLLVVLCSGALIGDGVVAKELKLKEGEKILIDEISSIIADDVLRINRRLPGVKSKEQEKAFLRRSALKTSETIQPLLDKLSKVVDDPKNARENIIELIKVKTTAKAVDKVNDDGDIKPRFIGVAINNIMDMTLSFVASVFAPRY